MEFGDRRLTPQEILYNFAETADDIKGGFNQILFVTNGIRTRFPDFEDDTECDQDCLDMIKENDKISTIIKECKKVIHVDNPPITRRTKEVEINVGIKEYTMCIEKLENGLEDLKRQMVLVYNPSTSSDISEEKEEGIVVENIYTENNDYG
ncbi:9473_t:CDS:2 [Entrophospora sp. SA101]|nr:9473_t:CDS:2 [Entrophospora sp. SA101]